MVLARTYDDGYERHPPSALREWLFQFFIGLPREAQAASAYVPAATIVLIVLNVAVFFAQMLRGDLGVSDYAMVPEQTVRFIAPWAVVTSMFMHGDIWHLIGNMYFLWVFGDDVEERLGIARYLGLYLIGGVMAKFAHIASDPSSRIPAIGASGAVAAVMGMYAVICPERQIYTMIALKLVKISSAWFVGLFVAFQVLNALAGEGRIAWWAHIGGVAFGVAIGGIARVVEYRRAYGTRPRQG